MKKILALLATYGIPTALIFYSEKIAAIHPVLEGFASGVLLVLFGMILLGAYGICVPLLPKNYLAVPEEEQRKRFFEYLKLRKLTRAAGWRRIPGDIGAAIFLFACILTQSWFFFALAFAVKIAELYTIKVLQDFDVDVFIPTIKNNLDSEDPNVRQFAQLMNEVIENEKENA